MKRLMKSVAILAAVLAPSFASAQDKVEPILNMDVVSNYVWRGMGLGSAAIQPSLGASWKGLSLTAWGSYGFVDKDDTHEIDLTLEYEIGGFSVGVTDYYCVAGEDNAPGRYFDYCGKLDGAGHVLEAKVGYDFGFLSANWYINLFGADGTCPNGSRAYSSYFELSAPFKVGPTDWSATVGISPYASSFYGNGAFACNNVALKASYPIKINEKFNIPVFAEISANPNQAKMFFMAGFSLGI